MASLRRFFLRLWTVLRPDHAETELSRELASHVSLVEDEYQRRGLTPEEARRAARHATGGVEQTKELYRDARGFAWLEEASRDAKYAARSLATNPGFTTAAVITLALAIGASSAIFSAVYAVLLRPLPISDPRSLVISWQTDSSRSSAVVELSYRNFQDWRAGNRSFADSAAMGSSNWTMVMDGRGEPVRLPFAGVTASFFETLGARPLLGRTFRPEDDVPNAAGVIVLNYGAWVRRFGADREILDTTVTLDERLYTIIGVMPEGFDFPRTAEFWTPVVPILSAASGQWGGDAMTNVGVLFFLGRLREGITPAAASEELNQVASRLATAEPGRLGSRIKVTPFLDYLFGPVRPALWLLLAAVGVLLLIACANISMLMLMQGSLRRREHAIRTALGATRLSLLRLRILEAFTLSLAGGVLALLACRWMAPAIVRLGSDDIPRLAEVSIGLPVLAFTCGTVVLTTLICSVVPVRYIGAGNLLEALNEAARGTPDSHSRRVRSVLVVFQIALAVVLLVSAGLVVRSFTNLRRINLGFSPPGVLTMHISPRTSRTSSNDWFQELLARVGTLPLVQAAGAVALPPLALGPIGQGTWFLFDGQSDTPEATRNNPMLNYQVATPGYFRAMGIPLKRGRLFDGRDDTRSPSVVIVGENTAERLWPGEDPIGKRLGMPTFTPGPRTVVWRTVVGVVADVRYQGLDDTSLDIYDPAQQAALTADYLVIRTGDNPLALVAAVQTVVRSLDPRVVIDRVTTLDAVVSRAIAPWTLSAWMFTLFATLAALLAAVGVFSIASLNAVSRKHEFAVRLSLGAQRHDIVQCVLTPAGKQVAFGVAVGLVAAVLGTRSLQSLLFGVEPLDGVTYLSVIGLVLCMVTLASYLPARRATKADPLTALRCE